VWKRKIRLKVYEDANLSKKIWSSDALRMDFSYTSTMGEAVDTCKIDIYNLALENAVKLSTTSTLHVLLEAGYEDEGDLETVFTGVVQNAWGKRQLPDHITSLYCLAVGTQNLGRVITMPVSGREETFRAYMNRLAITAGFSRGCNFIGVYDEILESIVPSRTVTSSAYSLLKGICDEKYVYFKVENARSIRVTPKLVSGSVEELSKSSKNKHVLELSRTKGLPEIGNQKIVLPYTLTPAIRAGDVIDTSEFVDEQSRSNSYSRLQDNTDLFLTDNYFSYALLTSFLLLEVKHAGSNYEDKWITTIKGHRWSQNTGGES